LTVGVLRVVPGRAPEAVARGPAAAEDAAVTVGRVLYRVDGGPRLVGRVDVRDLHAPGAAIQERGDNLGLVPDGTHDRRDAAQLRGRDAGFGRVDRDRAVLVVEQDPVEPEVAQHLDHGR